MLKFLQHHNFSVNVSLVSSFLSMRTISWNFSSKLCNCSKQSSGHWWDTRKHWLMGLHAWFIESPEALGWVACGPAFFQLCCGPLPVGRWVKKMSKKHSVQIAASVKETAACQGLPCPRDSDVKIGIITSELWFSQHCLALDSMWQQLLECYWNAETLKRK